MLQLSKDCRQAILRLVLALIAIAGATLSMAEELTSGHSSTNSSRSPIHWVTKVSQFRFLSGADFLAGCDFQLTGVITLVDTNRQLVVLQDATEAVALNFREGIQNLQIGRSVTMEGTNACPLYASFPDFPYRPSGQDIYSSFEGPSNWGSYNMTRMRGYLHPQVTGDYRFWIASDNSSELWLSTDDSPLNARRIAFVQRLFWADPHEWTKYPSQQSGTIQLKAGGSYYIEAIQEQTLSDEHLSVAWQEPPPRSSAISVIDSRYLTPWQVRRDLPQAATNGILREYWTNYSAGSVEGMLGARPFESALTVEHVHLHVHETGKLPKPENLKLGQPLTAENNYRWVQVEGMANFVATEGDVAFVELSDGKAQVQVCLLRWNEEMRKRFEQSTNAIVRIEGVCEGVIDLKGTMAPGRIWASADAIVSFTESGTTNRFPSAQNKAIPTTDTNLPVIVGYFENFGIVTFNDRVFDKDFIFIQRDNSAVQISLQNDFLRDQFKVGRSVITGGQLASGRYLQMVDAFFVREMQPQTVPWPIPYCGGTPGQPTLDHRWAELEGVVHSVNTNNTLTLFGPEGPAYLWLGKISSNNLARFIDAKVRARGVLMLDTLDSPLLLVPSLSFLDMEEKPLTNPYDSPIGRIAEVLSGVRESIWSHRVHVTGEVTYSDHDSFFVQDTSGGICVRTQDKPTLKAGQSVDVVAFPTPATPGRALTEPLVRPATAADEIRPVELNLDEPSFSKQGGALVQASATLLNQKTSDLNQLLELQEEHHVFTATLPADQGRLQDFTPGSRLKVIGVREDENPALLADGIQSAESHLITHVNILLRKSEDVALLSGPTWWSWKKAATVIGILLLTLVVAVLWIHLLHRSLERQQTAQLVFSQHVLKRLEEERQRIAINLHDSLGQTLLVIKHRALSASESLAEGQTPRSMLDEISGVASQAIDEVRRITHGLRPYQLDRLGLTQAIRASVSRGSENGSILFASRIESIDGLFGKEGEIHVYRIVQEAITNIVKHSAATEATVVIKKMPAAVSISIRDNGRGFDLVKLSNSSQSFGFGLSGLTERVRILKGTLVIDSKPDAGTSLSVEVPFETL